MLRLSPPHNKQKKPKIIKMRVSGVLNRASKGTRKINKIPQQKQTTPANNGVLNNM